jgi:outer membrane biosynthesis protein TonB
VTALFLGLSFLAALESSVGPRFAGGKAPDLPPLAANGGLVGLELRIAPSGIVEDAIVIDDAPPFTEELKRVVRLWRFQPRRENGARVEGRVALIALFRGQTLVGGGTPVPARISRPSSEIPYPTSTATPAYPPRALYSGVVMFEVEVDANGAITHMTVLDDKEGFAPAAAEAAEQFRFRPAENAGNPVSSRAVLVFGFPQPNTPIRPR